MFDYIIHHKRSDCKNKYGKLKEQKLHNTQCILLTVKNSGELTSVDKTFNDKTWLENSADKLGITYECLVSPLDKDTFAYTSKIPLFYDFLKTTPYEYVLISDATDAIITQSPDNAIKLLHEYDCDILYSVTHWSDHDSFTMPDVNKFTHSIYGSKKLNSGVCIGRTSKLLQLFERVLEYAEFIPAKEYHVKYRKTNGYKNWTKKQLKEFPKGVSCDQVIIRYLFKEFYPNLKLDINGKLALIR